MSPKTSIARIHTEMYPEVATNTQSVEIWTGIETSIVSWASLYAVFFTTRRVTSDSRCKFNFNPPFSSRVTSRL
jgi:hypothetical protein